MGSVRASIPRDVRARVYEKYDGHCAYCGKDLAKNEMTVDHLQPLYLGGLDVFENYMPACRCCNRYKSTYTLEKFREQVGSLHLRVLRDARGQIMRRLGLVEFPTWDGLFYFERVAKELEK